MAHLKEIRIYYESYEQAKHFVGDLIKRENTNTPIKFVRKKGGANAYKHYSKYLAPIIFWKDQDILVSVIFDNKEFPIFAIEFSAAVFTEDHELQRLDSMASALEAGCIYIKYSPLKRASISAHGGNVNFDYKIPYRVLHQRTGIVPFHIDWEVDAHGSGFLISDNSFLACPTQSPYLNEIINSIFTYIETSEKIDETWAINFSKYLFESQHSPTFSSWLEDIKSPITLEDIKITESARTALRDNTLNLKFNRFGHAMDPERGMLCYYGNIFENINTTMTLHDSKDTWYKATPNENRIKNYIDQNGLEKATDYRNVLVYAASLNSYDYFKRLLEEASTEECVQYDITDFINSNFYTVNKALRTIFKYSDSFIALDSRLKAKCVFKWERKNLKLEVQNLCEKEITDIEIKSEFEEDEITYIAAHEVLEKNGFKLLTLSYPGAQGDRAILPDTGSGRSQTRIYVDIISYLPGKYVNLNESKGYFDIPGLTNDIYKLNQFKASTHHFNALQTLLNKIDSKSVNLPVLLSVSFWENTTDLISRIPVTELEFFIVISRDRTKWKLFYSGTNNPFKIIEGGINMEETYRVV